MLSNNPFSSTSTTSTSAPSPLPAAAVSAAAYPHHPPAPPSAHPFREPPLRQPLYHTFVYTSLSHRSLCNPLSSSLAILATSTTPSVAFYPARTNTAPLPRCISFSPLFFPFTSPPPPTPSLSNDDETQPLTLGLLRIINFSHT